MQHPAAERIRLDSLDPQFEEPLYSFDLADVKARIPYSTGEVLNYTAVSEDSGRPNSSARESALMA